MADHVQITNAAELVAYWPTAWRTCTAEAQAKRTWCPTCDDELLAVGLPHLIYTFEVCDCGGPGFDHLVEQLWHRQCFAVRQPDKDH